MRTLGEQLKKARLDRGMQRTEVAFTLGVDPTTVRNWEQNRTQPTARLLPRIIQFIGHDPFPEPATVAERLLALRRQRGVSRKALAAALGLDDTTLREWERGRPWPRQARTREVLERLFDGIPGP